uniref:Glycine-rich cell wall structural protein 1 n=1 Tax=Angiostrongylus cantonensis TaxID=6313 RepID=A0A0K0DAK8_ANGCA
MRWLILLLLTVGSRAEEWDAYNYPNPTAGQFKECNMKTTANICDPDGVLSAVKTMANDMLRKWTLDQQCQKAVVFVKSLFQQSNYQQALTNIMQKTWETALSKQGSPRTSGGGGPSVPGPGFGDNSGGMGGGYKGPGGSGFKMPSIPGWFWALLFLVIVPLVCMCICCYCCCCRGKGGASARAQDGGMGGGGIGGGGRSGGGGSMFRNIASSAGGAGIGSLLGNILSGGRESIFYYLCSLTLNVSGGRGGMGGGGIGMGGGYGGGGYQGGGAYPATPGPVYDDNGGRGGGGLYPSKAVKDEGGGGSWA